MFVAGGQQICHTSGARRPPIQAMMDKNGGEKKTGQEEINCMYHNKKH